MKGGEESSPVSRGVRLVSGAEDRGRGGRLSFVVSKRYVSGWY